MTRDPLVDKKLAMRERLPDLCRILKAYPTFDSYSRLCTQCQEFAKTRMNCFPWFGHKVYVLQKLDLQGRQG